MKFLVLYFLLFSIVIVQSHEFKGFTLKFLYQVFTGDFSNLKRREKIEKNVLKNETSSYLGEFRWLVMLFEVGLTQIRLIRSFNQITLHIDNRNQTNFHYFQNI